MRLRLSLLAMLVATLVAAPAASADGVTLSRFELSGSFFNPCTNENVDLSGTVLTVIDTTPEDNHGLEGHSVDIAMKGVGATSGAEYIGVSTSTTSVQGTEATSDGGAFAETAAVHSRLIAPGPGNDLVFSIVFHFTINATGDVVGLHNRLTLGACV
jgi:hypothetical protein